MQHQDHCFSQLVTETADDFHHIGSMVDIQVIGRLVQKYILGVLGNDHGDHGPLPLASGKLVNEAVLEALQFHVGNGPVDDLLILQGDPVP